MRFDIIDLRGALTGFTTEEYRLLSAAVVACSNLSYSNMNCKWRIDMNDETTANEQQEVVELHTEDNTSGTVSEEELEDENTGDIPPELEASDLGTEQGEDNSVSVPGYNFISIEAV